MDLPGRRFVRDDEPLAIEAQPLPSITRLIVDFITAEDDDQQELRQFVLHVGPHTDPSTEDDRKRALDAVHLFAIPHVRQAFLAQDQSTRTFVLDTKQHWFDALTIVERTVPTVEATRSRFDVAPTLNYVFVKEPDSRSTSHRAFFVPLQSDRPEQNEANQRVYARILPHATRLHLGHLRTSAGNRDFLKLYVSKDDFEPLLQLADNITA